MRAFSLFLYEKGLLLADFDKSSIRMVLDYIDRYDVLHGNREDEEENFKIEGQNEFHIF